MKWPQTNVLSLGYYNRAYDQIYKSLIGQREDSRMCNVFHLKMTFKEGRMEHKLRGIGGSRHFGSQPVTSARHGRENNVEKPTGGVSASSLLGCKMAQWADEFGSKPWKDFPSKDGLLGQVL